MCGIHLVAGVAPERAKRAVDSMIISCAHRGPDSHATHESENVLMGFSRLEVVGGPKSDQPISNEDGSITIIGNGEVFNYRDLQKRHTERHAYKTDSDIEVLLHLYEDFGVDFIDSVEGQFSVVIYDARNKKVIFFRDRWGITPLFYSFQDSKFVISSSVRSIVASKLIDEIGLDPLGIAEGWSLYGPTPPRTCFSNISQLPPGSYGEYDLSRNTLKFGAYIIHEKQKAKRTVEKTLTESVRRRIQGSYGPGVYVSGGVDSSIIAALVNNLSPVKPMLFGIAFKDLDYDESYYQKMLAEHLGCKLLNIHIGIDEILSNLAQCVNFTESPLIRTASVPMMLLSREVRGHGLKYVLCGEGADELFAGYPVFVKGQSSVLDKWDNLTPYYSCFVDSSLSDRIQDKHQNFIKAKDNLDELRLQEISTKLSRYLLVNQGDRVAMANSVEQRFPFLDSSVAEIAFSLSAKELIKEGTGKQLLRSSFEGLLPPQLLNRKKQGYLTPDFAVVKSLLDSGVLASTLSEQECKIIGIFKYEKLKGLIDTLRTETDARFLLFAYTTHLLFKQFINSGDPENGKATATLTTPPYTGTLSGE